MGRPFGFGGGAPPQGGGEADETLRVLEVAGRRGGRGGFPGRRGGFPGRRGGFPGMGPPFGFGGGAPPQGGFGGGEADETLRVLEVAGRRGARRGGNAPRGRRGRNAPRGRRGRNAPRGKHGGRGKRGGRRAAA
ncbi:unnamed protein product [Aphanomyces euteiches]